MKKNISVAEAKEIMLAAAAEAKSEMVALDSSLGRYLAGDLIAVRNNPSCANSAMDGYGVRAGDLSRGCGVLEVKGCIYAGDPPGKKLGKGEALEIMTGAPIPEGVDAVVPVEETERREDRVAILKKPRVGENIRPEGEDYRAGDLLIAGGTRLTPAHVALLASTGKAKARVFRRPVVAVLSTGNELVTPGRPLKPGRIYESNSFSLCAQARAAGAEAVRLASAGDDRKALKKAVLEGLRQDVLVVSGGVSMGKADYLKQVMADLGAEILFSKVRQRPGNPLTFALVEKKPVFLLPGNPVSSLICFEVYARLFLRAMMGDRGEREDRSFCVLGETIRVKKGKTYFLRMHMRNRENETAVFLTGPQGSGILTSVTRGDCLLEIAEDTEELHAGSPVAVKRFSWSSHC